MGEGSWVVGGEYLGDKGFMIVGRPWDPSDVICGLCCYAND